MRLHNKCWGTILYGKTAQTSEVITWYWQPRHHKWTMMWWDRTIQQKWLIKKLYKASAGILPSQSKLKVREYDFSCQFFFSDEKKNPLATQQLKRLRWVALFFNLFLFGSILLYVHFTYYHCNDNMYFFFLSFILKLQDKDNGPRDEATEAGAT